MFPLLGFLFGSTLTFSCMRALDRLKPKVYEIRMGEPVRVYSSSGVHLSTMKMREFNSRLGAPSTATLSDLSEDLRHRWSQR